MASLKDKFLEGCAQNGVTPAVANQLWKDMEQAQDYSFNKSHAACYALIAYQTAWLKANHPCEYMAALISSVMNTKDKVPYYVNACDEIGIEVLPPDVNSSEIDFAVVEGKIRFGLNAVKGVGEAAARGIIAARNEGGPFTSIWDFTERVDPQCSNKRVLEALVKCGALDSTGGSRQGMLAVLEQALAFGNKQQADRLAGQGSIFDLGDPVAEEEAGPRHHPPVPSGEFDKNELLRMEKEVLGLYVSEHPLHAIRDQLRRKTDATMNELERRRDGEWVTVGGIVAAVKQLTTKKGEPMVFLRLDDVTGSAEVVVFNSVYAASRHLCVTDQILVIKGRVDHKQEGETKLLAQELTPFDLVPEKKEVRLRLDASKAPAGLVRELKALLTDFPGEAPVFVDMETRMGRKSLEFGPQFRVAPSSDFLAEVKHLLGEAAVLQ
jgi:DNA polymerase-3 subunit alpha